MNYSIDFVNNLHRRLRNIGIEIELTANFPFIYLYKVNGKLVTEKFDSEHGFVIMLLPISTGTKPRLNDSKIFFEKVRSMI